MSPFRALGKGFRIQSQGSESTLELLPHLLVTGLYTDPAQLHCLLKELVCPSLGSWGRVLGFRVRV